MHSRLFIISFFFIQLIAAQDSVFTANEVIGIAVKENLDIQIAQSDVDIAKINNNWGNAGILPTIAAQATNTEAVSNLNQKLNNGNSIQRNNVANNNLNANLNLSWRIYNGMRIRSTKERFEIIERMGNIAFKQQVDQVIFDVLSVYFNLVRLNKQVNSTLAIIDFSKERVKIAETRFNVGSGTKTDMLQAKIDLNAQEVSLQNIFRQIAATKASMNNLLKRNPSQPIYAKEEQFRIPFINLEEVFKKIDEQNFQMLMAQQTKLNLANDRKIIYSQKLPTLTLNSAAFLNRTISTAGLFLTNQTYGPNVGLTVGVPIFQSNINKTQLRVNTVQQKQQNLEIEALRARIQRDLYIAYQEYQNAIEAAKVEEINVKLAEENNKISTERFRKLQSNSIELRQAQLSLNEAQDRYINAQYRAHIAATSILFIIGEISNF
ncbi:MAG: TolC family protein [Bacteroidetes bacterium]|nr:TolC family protein [Bacteroidota bacterium]